MLLLSWAAVPYHHDISLTFVASSPINIACMVGCNIKTKRSVSFDDKQRPGLERRPGQEALGQKGFQALPFAPFLFLILVLCPWFVLSFLFLSLDYQLTDCSLRAFLLSGSI